MKCSRCAAARARSRRRTAAFECLGHAWTDASTAQRAQHLAWAAHALCSALGRAPTYTLRLDALEAVLRLVQLAPFTAAEANADALATVCAEMAACAGDAKHSSVRLAALAAVRALVVARDGSVRSVATPSAVNQVSALIDARLKDADARVVQLATEVRTEEMALLFVAKTHNMILVSNAATRITRCQCVSHGCAHHFHQML